MKIVQVKKFERMKLLGIYHMEEACWKGTEGGAFDACLPACLLHELQRHILHTKQLHLRNKSVLLELSHTHHTESSSSYHFHLSILIFPISPLDQIRVKKN